MQSCALILGAKILLLMTLYSENMITLDVVDRSSFEAIINATFLNSFETRSTDLNKVYHYVSYVHRANQFQNQYMTA